MSHVNGTRNAGGLDFRPLAEKTKVPQCFERCNCNRVQSTRLEWQEITHNDFQAVPL